MNLNLGNCSIAITGQADAAERLMDLLHRLKGHPGPVDLELHFADRLPAWGGQPFVKIGPYEVANDRFRLLDKIWQVQVEATSDPVRVTLAPRRMGSLKGVVRNVKKAWRYLHTHGRGGYVHQLKRLLFYVYMPMVELALLQRGSSFAHCSAIERDGRVALFPASGGVGKTSIMGRYIDQGWRFLSDDMCVISADGTASLHPLPMHIYKFHEVHCPSIVQRMRSVAPWWDRLLWALLGYVKRPDRLVRWVSPELVLGGERLAWQGRVEAVVYMHRYRNGTQFEVEPVSAADVASLMASVVFDEINNLAAMSIMVGSCQSMELLPTVGRLYQQVYDVFTSAFAKAACCVLRVPETATADDIFAFIEDRKIFRFQ